MRICLNLTPNPNSYLANHKHSYICILPVTSSLDAGGPRQHAITANVYSHGA